MESINYKMMITKKKDKNLKFQAKGREEGRSSHIQYF